MSRIIISLLFLVFISGCAVQNPKSSVEPLKINNGSPQPLSFGPYAGVTYRFATDYKNRNAKGGKVEWFGAITGLSQVDGIKFWILDNEHPVSAQGQYDWFWAIPSLEVVSSMFNEKPEAGQSKFTGDWVAFMLERYGGIAKEDIDYNGIYKITGIFDGGDCSYYEQKDPAGNQVCIANVVVEKIEKYEYGTTK